MILVEYVERVLELVVVFKLIYLGIKIKIFFVVLEVL